MAELTVILLITVITTANLFTGIECLEITRLDVPDFVENGTEEFVILDCEYTYKSKEELKLVVKWFHNEDPQAIYQWIPEINSIELSNKFDGRISTEFEVSGSNEYTKHRALKILRPTIELSGKYACYVTSLAGQDIKQDTMIVYALPTDVRLNYTTWDDMVQVTCVIEDVYPLPEIEMFEIKPGKVEPTPVDDVELYYEKEDNAYNVYLMTNISQTELATDLLRYFGCEVSLNGTEYRKVIKVPYFPEARADMRAEDGNTATFLFSSVFVVLYPFLTIMLILRW